LHRISGGGNPQSASGTIALCRFAAGAVSPHEENSFPSNDWPPGEGHAGAPAGGEDVVRLSSKTTILGEHIGTLQARRSLVLAYA